ncbi:MAG: rhomboid family intramembrane serine protease [Cyanobacteriota bacterium]|nr:rhomboid family intramembrane serine protease [Cyanobacteriota bacterium]
MEPGADRAEACQRFPLPSAPSVLLLFGCLLAYGGLLPALLPFLSPPGVSWIGHAAGFVGGLVAAWAMYKA